MSPLPCIDMRSDTVTKPTDAMRQAMANAEVGDDMMGEDPTVNQLEQRIAELLDKEAAVFVCSGTQSNQLALWAHCRAGDELLIHADGHIYQYEAGGPAVLHGVSCRTVPGPRGMIDVPELEAVMRPVDQHFCRTRLVCLENTTNKAGGFVWSVEQANRVGNWAHENGLRTHLDGARLFNACIAGGYSVNDITAQMDTVSICFSKGLGCPMGSILVGSEEDIAAARRGRKIFGGALRQAGIVAAAALYALDHHVERLADDHQNAKLLAEKLAGLDGIVIDPADVETNLVYFEVDPQTGTADQLIAGLEQRGIKMFTVGTGRIRACLHLDISVEDIDTVATAVADCLKAGLSNVEESPAGAYAYR